jgi:GDSL-like lipase/acylhydrolase family protein
MIKTGKYSIILILTFAILVHVQAREYKVFDVVGDSISYGINPDNPNPSGWVHILFGTFGSHDTIDKIWPGIQKYNSAVSGSKASDWAKVSYFAMDNLISHKPDLIVVFIGGNDFLLYCADGEISLAEMQEYEANLRKIIEKLQALDTRPEIIIVNYYDLFDGFSENLELFLTSYKVLSQATIEGNAIIRKVALEKKCFLVEGIYSAFLHHCYGEYVGDTSHQSPDYVAMPILNFDIHPVTKGHEAIYRNIHYMLQQLKSIHDKSIWVFY